MSGALLTTGDVSKMLSVHPITLRVWRCRKVGPPWIRLGPGRAAIRYDPEALQHWLDLNTVEPARSVGA